MQKESRSILSLLNMVDGGVNGVQDVTMEFELPLQSKVGVDICDLKSHPITSFISINPSFGDVQSFMFVGK